MFTYTCGKCGTVLYTSTTPRPFEYIIKYNAFAYRFGKRIHYACPSCLTKFSGRIKGINSNPAAVAYPIPATEGNHRDAETIVGYIRGLLTSRSVSEPELTTHYNGAYIVLEGITDSFNTRYGYFRYRKTLWSINALNTGVGMLPHIRDYITEHITGKVKPNRTIIEVMLQVGGFKPTTVIQPGYIYVVKPRGLVITPSMLALAKHDVDDVVNLVKQLSALSIHAAPVLDYYELTPGGRVVLRLMNANPKIKPYRLNGVRISED